MKNMFYFDVCTHIRSVSHRPQWYGMAYHCRWPTASRQHPTSREWLKIEWGCLTIQTNKQTMLIDALIYWNLAHQSKLQPFIVSHNNHRVFTTIIDYVPVNLKRTIYKMKFYFCYSLCTLSTLEHFKLKVLWLCIKVLSFCSIYIANLILNEILMYIFDSNIVIPIILTRVLTHQTITGTTFTELIIHKFLQN